MPPDAEQGLPADGEEPEPAARPWSPARQAVAALLWASFLAAACGTMLFFAFVDPAEMMHAIAPDPGDSRLAGYGYGFFFFWLLCLGAAALAVFLIRSGRRNNGNGSDH